MSLHSQPFNPARASLNGVPEGIVGTYKVERLGLMGATEEGSQLITRFITLLMF